jgi:hypothetical protein
MVRNFSVQKADELWTVLVFYLPWEAKLVTKHCAGQTVCATTHKKWISNVGGDISMLPSNV